MPVYQNLVLWASSESLLANYDDNDKMFKGGSHLEEMLSCHFYRQWYGTQANGICRFILNVDSYFLGSVAKWEKRKSLDSSNAKAYGLRKLV